MGQRQDSTVNLAGEWAPIFKVLADPTRLKLLLSMHYHGPGAASVSDLAEDTGVRTPTASAALVHMADAGVIEPRKEGRVVYYVLTNPRIHDLLHHLGGVHAHDQ
ncbi:Biofilm growth-associated repressor [Corynebacterium atrinae]|uniref:ArsR/SmtB family transcription factor n=1 Tax=Corynebacterium atrinae TaxID=1336740 RepID=UPI0025B40812|nr:metalloregulator ArsR/SmtB family transcription factor [Corynebacterium atrinae]WJY62349.1 Biofilm growth-associated repressor [Corynebacterium atrinae]